MLPRFLCEIPRLVMIGNSCLKAFDAAVMCVLVASSQPSNSPITSPRYWKVSTALCVSSLTCTWIESKLSVGALSPLHFLHLNMLSFFSVSYWKPLTETAFILILEFAPSYIITFTSLTIHLSIPNFLIAP